MINAFLSKVLFDYVQLFLIHVHWTEQLSKNLDNTQLIRNFKFKSSIRDSQNKFST